MSNWLVSTPETLLHVALSALAIYFTVIVATRISGLRTFAKMSSFDLAITVSFGTVIASTIMNSSQSVLQGVMVVFILIGLQALFSVAKKYSKWFRKASTNSPLLLMDGSEILTDNLAKARIEEEELIAKLREANVYQLHQVLAVVLETTGDISVLHAKDGGQDIDPKIMEGVRRNK